MWRERRCGEGNRCRSQNGVLNASASGNIRLPNVRRLMRFVDAVVDSTGPAYAKKTVGGSGNVPTARQQEMANIKDTGQRIEDARFS